MGNIEFRAWDKEGKCWVFLDVESICSCVYFGDTTSLDIPSVFDAKDQEAGGLENFCLFSGVKDRGGKKVYRGDRVQLDYFDLHLRGEVIQDDDGCWSIFQDKGNHVGLYHNRNRIKIIGNKYEKEEVR